LATFVRDNKPPLQNHFEAQVDILLAMSHAADRELFVTNNTSANREAFCRLFLASHLPPNFRVTAGEIIDIWDNKTGQLEVVIVSDFAPVMAIDRSIIAPIMADSVFGVIDVKTSLTCDTLKKALGQLRPVKALMPMHGTLQTTDGDVVEDPLGGKIVTGIFAFQPSSDIDRQVPDVLRMYPNVADFVVIPGQFGYFAVDALRVCRLAVRSDEIVNGYVRYTAKGMELALIFGLLNSIAAIRRFSGHNYVRYLSGSWGGPRERVARITREAQKSLQQIDKVIGRTAPKEMKTEFFMIRDKFNSMLGDFGRDMYAPAVLS
jgi:hypothetical protein